MEGSTAYGLNQSRSRTRGVSEVPINGEKHICHCPVIVIYGMPTSRLPRRWEGMEPDDLLCSRNPRTQKGETGAACSSSCSRNAHDRNVLVRRAHSRINQAAPRKDTKESLGMFTSNARSGRLSRRPSHEEERSNLERSMSMLDTCSIYALGMLPSQEVNGSKKLRRLTGAVSLQLVFQRVRSYKNHLFTQPSFS